jgi:hypothetical protein
MFLASACLHSALLDLIACVSSVNFSPRSEDARTRFVCVIWDFHAVYLVLQVVIERKDDPSISSSSRGHSSPGDSHIHVGSDSLCSVMTYAAPLRMPPWYASYAFCVIRCLQLRVYRKLDGLRFIDFVF